MNADGLRISMVEQGVRVLVRCRDEIPLRRVATLPVEALESVRLDPAALGAPGESWKPRVHLELCPIRVRGMPAADRGRDGLIVARTRAQAVEFLLAAWEPQGDGEPDTSIREVRASRAARHARLRELEERLERHPDDDDAPRILHHARRRSRPRFLWCQDQFDEAFLGVATRNHRLYLPGNQRSYPGEDTAKPAAVVERFRQVGRHRIPQWDVIVPREVDDQILCHGFLDGRWFQGPLQRVDPRILEVFDASGRLVSITEGDPLLGQTLTACFAVRVPRGGVARTSRPAPVPQVAAAIPGAFLVDSRSPVALKPDLPVIDDAAGAWAVLQRTMSGIFLPDAAPATLPRCFRDLAGRYAVACVPAPLTSGRQVS
jgi:hypothetical protein